jgi:hypothetical protein
LKIVQGQIKKTLVSTHPPRARGVGIVRHVLGLYAVLMRDARINFREGSFEWKFKVVVHFLRVKKDRRASPSCPPHLWMY